MYKFVKIAPNFGERKGIGTWYFVPNSVEQVIEHFKKIFGQEIKAGVHDKIAGYKHASSAWRYAVDMLTMFNLNNLEYNNWVFNATVLENQVLNNRIKDFENGKEMYLANGVVQFSPRWDMYDKIDELESNELVYPRESQFHFEEVRYMQWDVPGITKGQHWYAKIGNMDVKDKDGNMKWDTKEEAEEAAKWFCNELNYHVYFAKKIPSEINPDMVLKNIV